MFGAVIAISAGLWMLSGFVIVALIVRLNLFATMRTNTAGRVKRFGII
jgi:hypothetical protein